MSWGEKKNSKERTVNGWGKKGTGGQHHQKERGGEHNGIRGADVLPGQKGGEVGGGHNIGEARGGNRAKSEKRILPGEKGRKASVIRVQKKSIFEAWKKHGKNAVIQPKKGRVSSREKQ